MLKQILETRQQPQNNETPAHHIVNGSNAMLWTLRDARQFSVNLPCSKSRAYCLYICSWPEKNKKKKQPYQG